MKGSSFPNIAMFLMSNQSLNQRLSYCPLKLS